MLAHSRYRPNHCVLYRQDKKVSKTPELFGTGMIEGVVCPEIFLIFPSEITTFCEDKPAGLIYGFADPNADHITPRRSSLRRANSALTAILQLCSGCQILRVCDFLLSCFAQTVKVFRVGKLSMAKIYHGCAIIVLFWTIAAASL
jgi:hypothetical protein